MFGSCGLYYKDDLDLFELGYGIMFDRWNKGYTTEAASAIIEFAKSDLKLKQLFAQHNVDNVASGRVMLKNGFVPTGYSTVTNFDGTVHKTATYILDL